MTPAQVLSIVTAELDRREALAQPSAQDQVTGQILAGVIATPWTGPAASGHLPGSSSQPPAPMPPLDDLGPASGPL